MIGMKFLFTILGFAAGAAVATLKPSRRPTIQKPANVAPTASQTPVADKLKLHARLIDAPDDEVLARIVDSWNQASRNNSKANNHSLYAGSISEDYPTKLNAAVDREVLQEIIEREKRVKAA